MILAPVSIDIQCTLRYAVNITIKQKEFKLFTFKDI